MKKVYFLVLILCCSIFSIAQVEIKTTTTKLNLREQPGVDQKILCVIPANTNITVDNSIQEYQNWSKITYGTKVGYVYNQYLKTPSSGTQDYQLTTRSTDIKYYTNSKGERVQSPTYYSTAPSGATALCRDGTYSFSKSRRGTCSHHGGVAKWL